MERLYTHQRAAYDAAAAGRDTVVVTPTASGKTLCYNLPVLDRILKDGDTRALYLFPTKALAQDQLAELYGTIEGIGADIGTFTYDGDTPQDARKAIRARAHIVVTNPDMLHKGILPHHTKWVKLFENLRFVVIDELHQYRGVFGSHVANVIRRLHRVCRFYGSDPLFICCSATIANPRELAEGLIQRKVLQIDDNGAPRGPKVVAVYNPPVVNRELGIRESSVNAARGIGSVRELIGAALPNPVTDFMALSAQKRISSCDQELCVHCGNCGRCSYLAIAPGPDGFPVTNPERCVGCSICVQKCISGALAMRERTAAELAALREG
jgi:DEAD/DEAH box helicase domain-containing protein